MARIAVGGLQHETNSFAPQPATFEMFVQTDGWPGLCRGPTLLEVLAGINLPIRGFIDRARELGHTPVPLLWASATPSGPVTEDAFERLTSMLIDELRRAEPFDAVFLELHGAMVTEHLEDGEGELLDRVRARIGDRPLVASLDLHANVSERMVQEADFLHAYRTYPHVDLAATGARCAEHLDRLLRSGRRPAKAHRKPPFLIPVPWQCTLIEPARGLYGGMQSLERETASNLSVCLGFPAADIADCGPSVLAYADDQTRADALADALAEALEAAEERFAGEIWSPDAAVARAMAAPLGRPVILADVQDNPGAGGTGDTTGLLAALVRQGAKQAVLATICDPEAAARAHAAGAGARISLALGGRFGPAGVTPFEGDFLVERLGDGRFQAMGPMYRGSRMELGPMALLRIVDPRAEVRVIVASRKVQVADRAILHHLGVDPAGHRILALKSAVHFRADFQALAGDVLLVEAPGVMPWDPAHLPFRHLRPGLRLRPRGARSSGAAEDQP